MKRNCVIPVAVAGAIVVVIFLIDALRPRQPVYQGKRLSVWFQSLGFPPGQRNPDRCAEVLVELGQEAVPYLARHVGGPGSLLETARERIWPKLPKAVQARFPVTDDWRTHAKAAWVLGRIGPGAKAAVPALRDALHDRQPVVRSFAAESLGWIWDDRRETIDSLIEALRCDSDPAVRSIAAEALGRLGQAAQNALPLLVGALKSNDSWTRRTAAKAIFAIDQKSALRAFEALHEQGLTRDDWLILQTEAQMEALARRDPGP